MILADSSIRSKLQIGEIRIEPAVADTDIRPVGIRLHLARDVLVPKPRQAIDPLLPTAVKYDRCELTLGYRLLPGDFVLGATVERIQLSPRLVARLDGRSTLARLGLSIHCSSGVIDGNHDELRSVVLELKNLGNHTLILRPGLPIGLLAFEELSGAIEQPSQHQYQGQVAVQPPNLLHQQ